MEARTLEQANAVLQRFLADYNHQFAKPAQRTGSAYRKLDRRLDLDRIFSLQYARKVANDHVIRAGPGLKLQLPSLPTGKGFAGRHVLVCPCPDGHVRVYLEDRLLLERAADPWEGPGRAFDMQRSKAPRKKKPLRVYTSPEGPRCALDSLACGGRRKGYAGMRPERRSPPGWPGLAPASPSIPAAMR